MAFIVTKIELSNEEIQNKILAIIKKTQTNSEVTNISSNFSHVYEKLKEEGIEISMGELVNIMEKMINSGTFQIKIEFSCTPGEYVIGGIFLKIK